MKTTLVVNGITYEKNTIEFLVQNLGGVQAIKDRLKGGVMYGESVYLNRILMVFEEFKSAQADEQQ